MYTTISETSRCQNCRMVLTENNKSGYCSSFCEKKHKGIVEEKKLDVKKSDVKKPATIPAHKVIAAINKSNAQKKEAGTWEVTAYLGSKKICGPINKQTIELKAFIETLFKTHPRCEVSIISNDK